jgi:hypothetical protein
MLPSSTIRRHLQFRNSAVRSLPRNSALRHPSGRLSTSSTTCRNRKKNKMKSASKVTASAVTLCVFSFLVMTAPSAHAGEYCSNDSGGAGAGCDYSSMEQCLTTTSGIGGLCARDPFYKNPDNALAYQPKRGRSRSELRSKGTGWELVSRTDIQEGKIIIAQPLSLFPVTRAIHQTLGISVSSITTRSEKIINASLLTSLTDVNEKQRTLLSPRRRAGCRGSARRNVKTSMKIRARKESSARRRHEVRCSSHRPAAKPFPV